MSFLQTFSANRCDLTSFVGIISKMPRISIVNVSYNNIEEFESMLEIEELERLAELDLTGNPSTEYEDFKDMVINLVPHIEVLNNEILAEPGSRFKLETEMLERMLKKKEGDEKEEGKEEEKTTKEKIVETRKNIEEM